MRNLSDVFELPMTNDGNKLIEASGNVCATFNLPNEAKAAAQAINELAELQYMQE